jgi:hypothetical protein
MKKMLTITSHIAHFFSLQSEQGEINLRYKLLKGFMKVPRMKVEFKSLVLCVCLCCCFLITL